jgi:xanthine dehydrogenase accessory factor
MDSVDLQVLATAQRWAAAGHRLAWVTVARTWGSAPRPAGSWLVVRDDGLIEGSVSGGCIEDNLVDRMRAGEMRGHAPFTLRYGVTQEEARRIGLPCGGTLDVVVEPAPSLALLDEMAARLARRELVCKEVDLTGGSTSLAPAPRGATLHWDGERLLTVHGPQWRLLIVGAGQISHYLAQMAQALDYAVTVCEPREEYHGGWRVPGTTLVQTMPDDALLAMAPDARCAVVALTHDPKLDDLVLLEALKSPAFYVGAVGSRLNNANRRERLLAHFDLRAEEVGRLHGPVGLPIGSHTPPEIAVAILAEMVAVRNGVQVPGPNAPATPHSHPSRHNPSACAAPS